MPALPGRLSRAAALLVPFAGIALIFAAACGRDITGSGTGTGMRGTLLIQRPAFQTSTSGNNNDVTALRITISASGGATSASRVIADVTPNVDSLNDANSGTGGDQKDTVGILAVSFPIQGAGVTYSLVLKAINATGDTTYTGGPALFTANDISLAGAVTVSIRPVYIGPGANATRVVASPRVATLVAFTSSNQFQFSAQAFDATGAVIPRAEFQWTSVDTTIVGVDGSSGTVYALNKRGSTQVIVQALGTTAQDAVTVSVTLPANSLQVTGGGNNQTGAVGTKLPITVRAVAQDGVPVSGQPISFQASAGGSASPGSATTDASGNASTSWTLGPNAGTQSLTISSPNVPSTFVNATATSATGGTGGTSGGGVTISFSSGPSSAVHGQSYPVTVAVDNNGAAFPNAPITWTIGSGGGSVSPATSQTDATGHASATWTLGPGAGSQMVNASTGGKVAGYTITATAAAAAVKP